VRRPPNQQPALFTLPENHWSAGERNAAERYREPTLFTVVAHGLLPVARTARSPRHSRRNHQQAIAP
jgi:hypothetical protein